MESDTSEKECYEKKKGGVSKDIKDELVYGGPEKKLVVRSSISNEDITMMTVHCTACGQQINHHYKKEVKIHQHLEVIVCRKCFKYYGDGNFQKDENGADNYCSWCAEGGSLVVCDHCSKAFCKNCIRRNFGRKELRRVMDASRWECFICCRDPLIPLINYTYMIKEYSNVVGALSTKKSNTVSVRCSDTEAGEDVRSLITTLQSSISEIASTNTLDLKKISNLLKTHAKKVSQLINIAEDSKQEKQKKKDKLKMLPNGETSKTEVILSISSDDETDKITTAQTAEPKQSTSFSEEKSHSNEIVSYTPDSGNGHKESEADESTELANLGIEYPSLSELLDSHMDDGENFQSQSLLAELDSISPKKSNTLNDTTTVKDLEDKILDENDASLTEEPDEGCSGAANQPHIDDSKSSKEVKKDQPCDSDKHDTEERNLLTCSTPSISSGSERKVSSGKSSDEDNTPSEEEKTKKKKISPLKTRRRSLSENEKARRALQRSVLNSSDSSSEEDLPVSPRKKSPRKCKQTTLRSKEQTSIRSLYEKLNSKLKDSEANSSESSSLSSEEVPEKKAEKIIPDVKCDPKLHAKVAVIAEKLPLTVQDIISNTVATLVTTVHEETECQVKKASNESERADKEIASLLNIPKKIKRKAKGTEDEHTCEEELVKNSGKKSRQKTIKKDAVESNESESNSEEKFDKTVQSLVVDKDEKPFSFSANELSKKALLEDLKSSSEDNDSSEDDAPFKSRRKKKCVKASPASEDDGKKSAEKNIKKLEEEEDSDFMPMRKKNMKKYEKLLKMPAMKSDEENNSGKEKSHRKTRSKKQVIISDEESDKGDKKKAVSSKDSSSSSSSSSDEDDVSDEKPSRSRKGKNKKESVAKGRKRKRIKKIADSSEDENNSHDDDVKIIGQSSSTRKKIRKLMSDTKLKDETKAAAVAEEERRKRIEERQKVYNNLLKESSMKKPEDVVGDSLVLDIDPKTKKERVAVHPKLVKNLKPHQVNGIKFMYDCTIETIELLSSEKEKGSGSILAHCMGLGKTLQVVTYLHTVLTNEITSKHLRTALVVCPYNTVLNWDNEFKIWLDDNDLGINVYEMSTIKDNYSRASYLEQWQEDGGVMILGYDMFRKLAQEKSKRVPKRVKEKLQKCLLDPGPDIVVCDEGHILKNDMSAISKAMSGIRTMRRIVLTGTPLQNNLKEYHCMVQFVKPNLLGTKKEFMNRFVNPIMNGQCADSTEFDVKIMKKRVHILHKLLEGCVQRCDYSALSPFLPPKVEYVISVRLSEEQIKLYRHFLDHLARGQRNRDVGASIFWDFNVLRQIWTHPYLLKLDAERQAQKQELRSFVESDSAGSMADFIDDGSSEEGDTKSDEIICLDDPQPGTSKDKKEGNSSGDEVIKTWQTRSRGLNPEEEISLPMVEQRKLWWQEYLSEESIQDMKLSGKMIILFDILKQCEVIGDKILIFSQSLLILDLIETLLSNCDENNEKNANVESLRSSLGDSQDYIGTWVHGVDYFRMDGSTGVDLRKRWIEIFNDDENQRARLFMISTKAGSLGTNLVGANRVVIMDASWNPTHDIQAIFRVYRFGQKKPVYIYRLLAQGTMEEKIYDRQVTKQSLSCRVVDEQQIERHFNASDLAELYTFSPDSKSNRPTPMVPKDRFLAELLIRQKDWFVTFHEHDSLLQNVTAEELSEEERKAAWEEYNNEREGLIRSTNFAMNPGAYQQGNPSVFTFSLDLNKIVESIKKTRPNISQNELLIHLKDALLLYRGQYQKQQIEAFKQRVALLERKEQVPPHLTSLIGEAGAAIQQLDTVIQQLQLRISQLIPQAYAAPAYQWQQQQANQMYMNYPRAANQSWMQNRFQYAHAQQRAQQQAFQARTSGNPAAATASSGLSNPPSSTATRQTRSHR